MTEQDLEKLKILLSLGDEISVNTELLLGVLWEDVYSDLVRITHNDDIPSSLIRKLVVIRYNVQGSEGLSSENYEGVSQNIMDDLPGDIKREINSLRKVEF